MADDREIEEAFERGRLVGQREGLAFTEVPPVAPWSHGAKFRFKTSWFESFVAYERDVLDDLRRVQHGRWVERGTDYEADLEQLQEKLEVELSAVRSAVDRELEEGRGRPCVVEAMRVPPQRPLSVCEFESLDAFVDQDRRRAVFDWPRRRDAAGADYGYRWRLENPFKRWETTQWRVSWLCEDDDSTKEVYAVEFFPAEIGGARLFGRVWLLGKLQDWQAAKRALGDLQRHAQNERNSLIVAAKAIGAAGQEEEASR
jgi:hypothetical protein